MRNSRLASLFNDFQYGLSILKIKKWLFSPASILIRQQPMCILRILINWMRFHQQQHETPTDVMAGLTTNARSIEWIKDAGIDMRFKDCALWWMSCYLLNKYCTSYIPYTLFIHLLIAMLTCFLAGLENVKSLWYSRSTVEMEVSGCLFLYGTFLL